MKRHPGRLLAIVLLFLPVSSIAADFDHVIKLATGHLSPPPMRSLPASAAALQGKHVLVQFEGPVTDPERARLFGQGVELLEYIPNHTYTARLHGPMTQQTLEDYNIRYVDALKPEQKISPFITEVGISDWARRGDNRVQFTVVMHSDEDLQEWANTFESDFGADIVGTVSSNSIIEIIVDEPMYFRLSELDAVLWIEPALPEPRELNNGARVSTGAEYLQAPPFDLKGVGIIVAEWDGGRVDVTHPDFRRRIFTLDGSAVSEHATHVAGTVMGSGEGSGGVYRGMAPEAELYSQLWWTGSSELSNEYNVVINSHGATVATNSWGYGVGDPATWSACENTLGNYFSVDGIIDNIVRGSEGAPITICWSAGNARSTSSDECGSLGWVYGTIGALASSKNIITVGAIYDGSSTAMTSFSSWGPTDDGRLKPDVVGPGCVLTSCKLSSGYTSKCGTSMSCPAVAGVVALLQEQWGLYIGTGTLLSSTTKGILINTAIDLGETGPDYSFGHGKVDGVAAATKIAIGEPSYVQGEISTGSSDVYDISLNASAGTLKVTLVWDDAGGTASASQALKNDLDLVLIDPFDGEEYPWILNPSAGAEPASKGEDHLNNVETVEIYNPLAGLWKAVVTGYNIPSGPQAYSLIFSPDSIHTPGSFVAVAAYSAGDVSADPGSSAVADFWVTNVGANLDSMHVQISDDALWLQTTVDTVVHLNPYDSVHFVLTADIPPEAYAGQPTHITCAVSSLTSPQATDENVVTASANTIYDLALSIPPEDTVESPEVYTFDITVTNQGNGADGITILTTDENGWTFSPWSRNLTLASLDSTTVSFDVLVPAEVPHLSTNQLTIWAVSNGDFADTSTFLLVADNAVFPPSLVSPEPVIYTQERVQTFEWTSDTATSFSVYVAEDIGITDVVRLYTGIAETSFEMPPADSLPDGSFFWAVRRYLDADSSSLQLYPREIVVDNQPPTDVSTDSPYDGGYVNNTSPLLQFSEVEGDPKAELSPELGLAEVSQDETFVAGVMQYDSLADFTYQMTDLLVKGRWYWRVQRFDLAGNYSPFSPPAGFVVDTEAPPIPTLVLPEDGTIIGGDTIALVWHTDEPAAYEESPERYYLHVSNRADFADFSTFQGYVHDTTKLMTSEQLDLGTTYYWRLRGFDSAGFASEYSLPFNFDYLNYICGDADGNGELPDIGDLTHLISYLYIGGPAPEPYAAGSVDCDEIIDIGDVTRLIAYLFISGEPLCCLQ